LRIADTTGKPVTLGQVASSLSCSGKSHPVTKGGTDEYRCSLAGDAEVDGRQTGVKTPDETGKLVTAATYGTVTKGPY
jgi:hypothetical protein